MHKRSNLAIYLTAAILLALTACGSVWDLEIAHAIYIGQTPSENMLGIIFSLIGVIPTFVGWSFLGAIIFVCAKKQMENIGKKRRLTAYAILLFVLSFFYFCNTLYISNANAFKIHFAVAYSIGLAVICLAAYLGYRLAKKCGGEELLKSALLLATVSLVALLIISCTKEILCRPRFRFVLAMDNADYFRNWWQSGRALKKSLDTGTVTDEFASFPSGHSAYAMFAIFLLPSLGDHVRGLKKYKPFLFAFGLVWWGITALSRLTTGAHYLTDVTIAGLVTILAHAAVLSAVKTYRKRSE